MQKMSEEIAIYCLKAESERYSEVCEECPQYGKVGCDHCCEDAFEVAIQALEKQSMVNEILHECTELKRELDAYNAIGTVEEVKQLKENAFTGNELAIIASNLIVLRDYQSIGTVEELQKSVKEEDVGLHTNGRMVHCMLIRIIWLMVNGLKPRMKQ